MEDELYYRRKRAEVIRLLKEAKNDKESPGQQQREARPVEVRGHHNVVISVGNDVHRLDVTPSAVIGSAKRPSRPSWRDELIGLVVDRAAEIGMSAGELNLLISAKIVRDVNDISDLTVEELGRMYELVDKLKRPAME